MPRRKNPTSDMDVAKKMKVPLAQRLNTLITDGNALKDFLDCSIQAVNQYKLGISRPSLENLCKIADFYGVSTDYLLGRTDTPSVNENIQIACRVTRLSQKSVENINKSVLESWGAWRKMGDVKTIPYPVTYVINLLLESGQLKDIFEYLGLFLIYGNARFFNNKPVSVTQDEMNRVADRMEYDGYSAASREQLSEMNLQLACDTLKAAFREILENEKVRLDNGQHQKRD